MKKRLISILLAGILVLQNTGCFALAEEVLTPSEISVEEENLEETISEDIMVEEVVEVVEETEFLIETESEVITESIFESETEFSTEMETELETEINFDEEIIIDNAFVDEADSMENGILGDAIAEGFCGTNVRWRLDSSYNLTISGVGLMDEYEYDYDEDYSEYPWEEYRGSIMSITIADGVLNVPSGAFCLCEALDHVTLSDTVKEIGMDAFFMCEGLQTVEFGKNVVTIGDCAFDNCTVLYDVILPDSVETIGDYAFDFCEQMVKIRLGKNLKHIGESAFTCCDALESITIPGSVKSMGDMVFDSCLNLRSVHFLGNVPELGEDILAEVEDVIIFYPEGNTGWEALADSEETFGAEKVRFEPTGVKWELEDGQLTIYEWNELEEEFTDPSDAPWYEERDSVETIIVREEVEKIGDYAFADFTNVEYLRFEGFAIPIGKNAFQYNVMDVYCDGNFTSWNESVMTSYGGSNIRWHTWLWSLDSINFKNILQIYGKGVIQDFSEGYDPPWHEERHKVEKISIDYGITEIGDWTFNDCSKVTEIEMSATVETLGDYAFADCESVEEIEMGTGVKKLDDYVFINCEELTSVFFYVNAPAFSDKTFASVSSKHGITMVYYPKANSTWNSVIESEYGGNVGWAVWDQKKKPFLATRDGWGFANYSTPEKVSYELTALADGCDDCFMMISWAGGKTYADEATKGLCAGMVLSAALTYKGSTPVTWWKTDGSRPADFVKSDKSIYSSTIGLTLDEFIQVMYMRQNIASPSLGKSKQYKVTSNNASYQSLVNAVNSFAEDQTNPVIVSFGKKKRWDKKSAGHTVMAYRSEKLDDAVRIYVYDSNIPLKNDVYMDLFLDDAGNYCGWKYYYPGDDYIFDDEYSDLAYINNFSDRLYTSFEYNSVGGNSEYRDSMFVIVNGSEEFSVVNGTGDVVTCSSGVFSEEEGNDWFLPENLAYMSENENISFCVKKGETISIQHKSSSNAKIVLADENSDFTLIVGPGGELSVLREVDGVCKLEVDPGSAGQVQVVYKTQSGSVVKTLKGNTGSKAAVTVVSGEKNLAVTGFKALEVTTTENDVTSMQKLENLREDESYNITNCQHDMKIVVLKKGTCVQREEMRQECSKCGAVDQKSVTTGSYGAHNYTKAVWKLKSAATVFAARQEIRTCTLCKKQTQTRTVGKNLTPTISVTADTIPLKVKQSTSGFAVSGLANGDSIKSITIDNEKIAKLTSVNLKKGTFKITAQKKTGTAKITIILASKLKKTVTVKVQKGAVKTTKVTGVESKMTLAKGKKITLKPIKVPFTSLEKFKYTTSNKKVVKVTSKGQITAVSPGTAKITVKVGKKKAVCTVTVPGITSVKSSISLKKKKSTTLKPKLYGISGKVSYTSSNPAVATVTAAGKITAVAKGKTTITVKVGTYQAKCAVKVK